MGGIEYNKVGTGASAIELIHIPEGYIERNSSNQYTYHYNLTDHLGNVRATLQRTSATVGTVIQKNDYSLVFACNCIHELPAVGYYPFGKAKALVVSGKNKYLNSGKEIQVQIMQPLSSLILTLLLGLLGH